MSYLDPKRQLGVSEEAPEQVRATPEALDLLADPELDLLDMVGGEVGESAVLEIRPDLLHGVEFRGIRREPFYVPGGTLAEVMFYPVVAMWASQVPQQDEGPGGCRRRCFRNRMTWGPWMFWSGCRDR